MMNQSIPVDSYFKNQNEERGEKVCGEGEAPTQILLIIRNAGRKNLMEANHKHDFGFSQFNEHD